jgi:hypothetical protein
MNKKYLLFLICFGALKLFAQEKEIDSTSSQWNFSAWAEMYIIPGEEVFFNPTFYANHKSLHLEGRYNYEDRSTASLWAGRRFEFGKGVKFVFIPMASIVFGNTNGMAPGLETSITYGKFDLYSENEYVFDFTSKSNNFFYAYSELAISPLKPIRTGATIQRTRVFESPRELQRGIFLEYYFGKCRGGAFYFNPFSSDNYWIASFSVDF